MHEKKIRLGIVGLGNVTRGVIPSIHRMGPNDDFELICIFTRRDPKRIRPVPSVKLVSINEIESYIGKIDVLILCTETQSVPILAPKLVKLFPVIIDCTDSSLTQQEHQEHRKNMDSICKISGHLAFIEAGWGNTNGLFGIIKTLMETTLPSGITRMKFGPGVNLGHQNIIQNLPGVKDATVWTLPTENKCYVLLKKFTFQNQIVKSIEERLYEITGKKTTVIPVKNQEELYHRRSTMSYQAMISHSDVSGSDMRFFVNLQSNPNYTGSLLVACARAAVAMYREGNVGVITFEDIPPKYFKPCSNFDK